MAADGNVHFSSARQDWATPKAFYDRVWRRFGGFTWDCAATAQTSKCAGNYFGPDHVRPEFRDALSVHWPHGIGPNWLNPPYGRAIGAFVAKAASEATRGAETVVLVPSRTDTTWWHEHVMNAPHCHVIWLVRGRLKFDEHKNSAPFPSALLIYRDHVRQTDYPSIETF